MGARGKILFVLFTIGLAFGLGEGGLRLYFALAPDPPGSRYVRDPDSRYRLRPGPFWEDGRLPDDRVNSFGFRDREHEVGKPKGVDRIVGIGDSFVLGAVPIEENFLRVAERALNDSPPADSIRCEVALMGLGGYGPENELGVLHSAALAIDPDLVVLCFYIGNDITGIPLRGEVLGGELYFVRSENFWHNLLRKSRLFVVIEKAIVTRWRLRNLESRDARLENPLDRTSEPWTENEEFRPSLYYLLIQKKRLPVYAARQSEKIAGLWKRAEEILDRFDQVCREASVPWILLLIPAEEQVDRKVRSKVLQALSLEESDYSFDAPQRRLLRFAHSRGIDALDLLPVFRSRCQEGTRLYIPNDTHWNHRGNALAGEVLSDRIRRRLAVDLPRSNPETVSDSP